jgi:hypothetical protein
MCCALALSDSFNTRATAGTGVLMPGAQATGLSLAVVMLAVVLLPRIKLEVSTSGLLAVTCCNINSYLCLKSRV